MPKTNRWHPVMLPDDYLRKLKQDLSESDASSETIHLEPDPEHADESQGNEPRPPKWPQPAVRRK